ncbi:hypothetical protein [Streptomyces sp. NPDC127119]|uniref:hypothetical protein n=1 Tax=Streptomyces sp. NPDC127119 TaxID=3345370 RepID=UPI00363B1F27
MTASYETIDTHLDGRVLHATFHAPPINLIGPELVRDLVGLIEELSRPDAPRVVVFDSADDDFFFPHPNHLLGGAVPAMLCGTGALATAVMRASSARSCIVVGCVTLAVGPGLTAVALGIGNSALFYTSTVIAGVGFGVGYLGALRSLVNLADPEHRGALVSAIYLVAYTAFSVPVVVAGAVATREGLEHTAIGFCVVLAVLAVTALVATLRTSSRAARIMPPNSAGPTDSQSS